MISYGHKTIHLIDRKKRFKSLTTNLSTKYNTNWVFFITIKSRLPFKCQDKKYLKFTKDLTMFRIQLKS